MGYLHSKTGIAPAAACPDQVSQTVRRPPLPHAHAAAAWLRRTPPRWRSAAWHFSCRGFFKRSHDRAMISCLNVAIQFEYDLHVLKASSSNSNYIHRKWIGNFEPVVAQYKAKVQMARIIRTECDQSWQSRHEILTTPAFQLQIVFPTPPRKRQGSLQYVIFESIPIKYKTFRWMLARQRQHTWKNTAANLSSFYRQQHRQNCGNFAAQHLSMHSKKWRTYRPVYHCSG